MESTKSAASDNQHEPHPGPTRAASGAETDVAPAQRIPPPQPPSASAPLNGPPKPDAPPQPTPTPRRPTRRKWFLLALLCHGARQNQPGRGASKPANVLTYSIPHPFYPTQLFLELLVPVHAVWPADTPTSEDNGGSVTVSSGGEHPSSPAVLRRPFGFVFSGVPDWPAVSEVEWPPCRRR